MGYTVQVQRQTSVSLHFSSDSTIFVDTGWRFVGHCLRSKSHVNSVSTGCYRFWNDLIASFGFVQHIIDWLLTARRREWGQPWYWNMPLNWTWTSEHLVLHVRHTDGIVALINDKKQHLQIALSRMSLCAIYFSDLIQRIIHCWDFSSESSTISNEGEKNNCKTFHLDLQLTKLCAVCLHSIRHFFIDSLKSKKEIEHNLNAILQTQLWRLFCQMLRIGLRGYHK